MRMGGGGGALIFGGSHCWNFVVTIVSVTVQCPLFILLMYFYQVPIPKGDLALLGKSMIDENLHYKVQFACYVVMRPSLYWPGGGGGGVRMSLV